MLRLQGLSKLNRIGKFQCDSQQLPLKFVSFHTPNNSGESRCFICIEESVSYEASTPASNSSINFNFYSTPTEIN